MTESDKARLIAWGDELRAVHQRLRDALRVTRETLGSGTRDDATRRDLLLYCHGFCTALTGHHRGEDRELFPAIAAEHPELAETLRRLEDDHAMIATLLDGLRDATEGGDPPERLGAHLEGIAAIMESHFQYEERRLLTVLDAMALDADPHDVFGPL
ncbi:MAG: hemerythrin domain-containing protein [Actinobacteria bacterium]|nr:hemerythrin domain-containing protein [Actinomycetota bacterium]